MTDNPIKLVVVIASVRDGRLGPTVADWFVGQVMSRADMAVDVVDLLDHPLPLVMPASGQQPATGVATARDTLSARLSAGDAFVVVTPEYNHSFPAALKNLLDWFLDEWAAKAVGFVSYGGMSGGLRAVEHLRQVFAELHAVTVRESVSFHDAWTRFDGHGRPYRTGECEAAAKALLDQVHWWAVTLRDARTRRPYRR
ncbi:NADPH-dependent FMN reductase [Plantactinospora sp. CA-294935]|uniref:NADPH-dependent FMN reductase n=1 Tax=Plantactinospora sp. CA-294935 TaxID=3240012 RepID=UPI003D9202EA